MKTHFVKTHRLALAVLLGATATAWAASQPATAPSADADDSGLVVAYQGDPSAAGKVTTRLEAEGGRCISDPSITQNVLCGPTTGLTVSPHPKLVWTLNKPISLPVRILLTDPDKHQTTRLWESSGLVPGGIHVLDLSQSKTELQPGVEYKWTVRIVNDPGDPSKDMYSSGAIRRIDASDPDAAHHAFYDSMATIVTAMADNDPSNQARHDQATAAFAHLLELANLPPVPDPTVTIDVAKD